MADAENEMPRMSAIQNYRLVTWLAAIPFACGAASAQVKVPKAWTDKALVEWATPLAGLDLRPAHFSEAEIAHVPIYKLYRSYTAYHPDREPPGYWAWLQSLKPEPLIEPAKLFTRADWVKAGQRVFREMYLPPLAGQEKLISLVRSRDALRQAGIKPHADGSLNPRWVVTPAGLRIAAAGCQSCHQRISADGSRIDGIPIGHDQGAVLARLQHVASQQVRDRTETSRLRNRYLHQFAVPWVKDDIHERFKTMTSDEFEELERSLAGVLSRDDGSPFYPVKIPDLIGIQERRYLDHTGTHRHRGIEDLMRYAALVTCCFSGGFGVDRRFAVADGSPSFRYSDELLFALASYIYSLEPPPNPNRMDAIAEGGRQVFVREGCPTCHTPPQYTNNKLTLARGYKPRSDHTNTADILPVSVNTDPGTAFQTRKGTGFYKVPSLKGVWYRGRYGHDGSVTTLAEWFNPARLKSDYVPEGWKGFRVKRRAVPGHEFGLRLRTEDKKALIAFLNTL